MANLTKDLDAIRAEVRARCDTDSNRLTDTIIDPMINASLAELYDKLIEGNKDWFVTSGNISVVSGTVAYSLPSDFYRLVGVDVQESDGDWANMRRFNFAERNQYQDEGINRRWTRYRIVGSNIRFRPSPNWTGTVRLWYIPALTILATGSDSVDSEIAFPGWDEFVVVDCTIKFKSMEESDATLEVAQKAALLARIQNMAADRDDNEPDRVRDIMSEFEGDFFNI